MNDLSSDDDFVVEKKPSTSKGNLAVPVRSRLTEMKRLGWDKSDVVLPPKAGLKTPKSRLKSEKQQPYQFDSPVFLSNSDDDSDIGVKSTWRTRHSRPSSQEKDAPVKENKPRNAPCFPSPLVSDHTPKPSSVPHTHSGWREDTGSSDEEFQSLLDRIRKNQKLGSSSTQASPKPPGKITYIGVWL